MGAIQNVHRYIDTFSGFCAVILRNKHNASVESAIETKRVCMQYLRHRHNDRTLQTAILSSHQTQILEESMLSAAIERQESLPNEHCHNGTVEKYGQKNLDNDVRPFKFRAQNNRVFVSRCRTRNFQPVQKSLTALTFSTNQWIKVRCHYQKLGENITQRMNPSRHTYGMRNGIKSAQRVQCTSPIS